MNLQESIRRVLREEINIPTYIKRRLYVVDEYISNLNPEDVCRHWPRRDQVNEYVSGFMAEIVRVILDDMPDLDPDEFGEMFDEIYGILIDLGYRKKIRDFFYESLQNCDPKHRIRFMRP